jgi:5-methyltetrahydropteroyltriglutamate--homocysteine methyltransferase
MKRSTDRILTTHVGSLPRPDDWLAMLLDREAGKPVDPEAYAVRNRRAVSDIVLKQIELGIDVIDDGEQGKSSFMTYVNERLAGFDPGGPRGSPWRHSREGKAFPEFYAAMARPSGGPSAAMQMVCTGPIAYKGHGRLQTDIQNFKAALQGVAVEEAFMPAISPSNIEDWQRNEHYKDEEEYVFAIAEAMREEYQAIVDAGFVLQIDDPRLATHYVVSEDSIAECRKWAEIRVEALNHALRGIPEDRIRFHTCYGINMGPRIHDLELKHFIDIMLRIRAGSYSFESANPRHEHEWRDWAKARLRPGTILMPGVISHTTVLVEHPELVAERIERYARIVGRESVIAGSDCGFATFATSHEIHPTIVWAKLASLTEGARIASRRLWSRSAKNSAAKSGTAQPKAKTKAKAEPKSKAKATARSPARRGKAQRRR